MRILKTVGLCLASAAAGVAFVLACGDDVREIDAGGGADASTRCDCPPAPEPIENRIRVVTKTATMSADVTDFGLDISCVEFFGPQGGKTLLSGGCSDSATLQGALMRVVSGNAVGTDGWECLYNHDPGAGPFGVTATAICLVPEGTPPADIDAGP